MVLACRWSHLYHIPRTKTRARARFLQYLSLTITPIIYIRTLLCYNNATYVSELILISKTIDSGTWRCHTERVKKRKRGHDTMNANDIITQIQNTANEIATATINKALDNQWQTQKELTKTLLKHSIEDDNYLTTMYQDPEYKQLLVKHITLQLIKQTNTLIDEATTNEQPAQPDEEKTPTTNEPVANTNKEESSESQVIFQQLKTAYDSDNYRTIQQALKIYRQYRGGCVTFKLNTKKVILKQAILNALRMMTEIQAIMDEHPDEVTTRIQHYD